MFIVEVANGPSFLPVSAEGSLVEDNYVEIFHASGRPGLQLLAAADFGNGSAAECDGFPAFPPGGVPGFDPPWIDCGLADMTSSQVNLCESRSTETSAALRDLACRFALINVEGNACTKDRFGNFAFLSGASNAQFCYSLSADTILPAGDIVVAAQVRDLAGNLGPAQEIVLRVVP